MDDLVTVIRRKKRTGEWSELALIHEIKKKRVLYDKTLKDYRKPNPTETAWEHISRNLNANIEDCKKRWKSLRDTFIKYYRMEVSTNSPMNSRQKVWKYYDELGFLRDHVELFRMDEKISSVTEQRQEYLAEIPEETAVVRHDFISGSSSSSKPKTNTFKVLVENEEGGEYDGTEYTVFETNQDGELEEVTDGGQEIFLEPQFETTEYNEPAKETVHNIESEKQKNSQKKIEILNADLYTNDPDEKFLMSCLPVLKRLPVKKNALLKLKIQTLLYEMEFGDSDDESSLSKRKKK